LTTEDTESTEERKKEMKITAERLLDDLATEQVFGSVETLQLKGS